MSRSNRRRPSDPPREWHPFLEQSRAGGETTFRNNLYAVVIRDHGMALHFAITPLDGRVKIQNLPDMQRIKTELAGANREAVQIFPAENRRAYLPGAFHLWVLKPDYTVPRLLAVVGEWSKTS